MKNNRIKELREKKGLTLKDVAKKAGVDFSTVSKYENNVVKTGKLETWKKLAEFFEVDVPYLQGFNNIPKIPKGLVTRNDSETEIHVTSIGMNLPDGTSLIDATEEELLNRRAEKALNLFYALYPKQTAEYFSEEFSDYSKRAEYFNSVQHASNTFLNLLENEPSPTKEAIYNTIFSILTSVQDMYDDDSISFKNFIKELDEIKTFYTSPENWTDKKVPWE